MEEIKQQSGGLKGELPIGLKKKAAADVASPPQSNLEMHENELKEFLMNRIAELRQADDHKLEDLNCVKFKFRASTISNVLPSGDINE